jgi:hypothetical protein
MVGADNYFVGWAVAGGAGIMATRNLRDLIRREQNLLGPRCFGSSITFAEEQPMSALTVRLLDDKHRRTPKAAALDCAAFARAPARVVAFSEL